MLQQKILSKCNHSFKRELLIQLIKSMETKMTIIKDNLKKKKEQYTVYKISVFGFSHHLPPSDG